ncbi:glycine cleavage system H protein (lipoate-binding) [Levilactobacillus senmaizukei DSM 21775 = NBRC 103853]|uniref:Glycine cleavage system H protein (Lipoate-binding) n=1 Tax=Levilactobacillus senmaizukei DSM 21775 = NBRC 103853 TaxID=1423803 RepID=A0A0R2DSA1_9LACO|nr:glycine cleavage system protein H [Levilactobacillus senmaizukei]KRN03308.1 glycine cleavage system H protein (lipoate-binding) [Levilactobacillus senmaizukei DSM 21775 = NBRC 103853]
MSESRPSLWQRLFSWWPRHKAPEPSVTIKDGVWLEQRDQGHYRLGLSSDALDQIGEISFADLPVLDGDVLAEGDDILEVESDKAVENFKTPVAGTIIKVNEALITDPSRLNENSQSDNWVLDIQSH